MARPKTEFRNELKTRVADRTYEGVQRYLAENRCTSEARAIAELLDLALFGMVGSVPGLLADIRPEMGQCGTKTQA
jgi:hypothetical protein